MLFAPLAAILLPALTNFEHQNMNALLLALIAGATWQTDARVLPRLQGSLSALPRRLKVFPALLILYFVARRYWTAAIAAIVSTIVLSVAPVAIYGARFLRSRARHSGGWATVAGRFAATTSRSSPRSIG